MNPIEIISIDLSNHCSKGCPFCYNQSTAKGASAWTVSEVIAFAKDCIAHGTQAISLGGGEPFEYDGIFEIISVLYPLCYLSVTSNGLPLLQDKILKKLTENHPDKIHISIHNPGDYNEVERIINQLLQLKNLGIKTGVNLLISDTTTTDATSAYGRLRTILKKEQIILIPIRPIHTPTPKQLSEVANGESFQAPSCLLKCSPPSNFVSVSWDKKVNRCSFAPNKVALKSLDYDGLMDALRLVESNEWESCH